MIDRVVFRENILVPLTVQIAFVSFSLLMTGQAVPADFVVFLLYYHAPQSVYLNVFAVMAFYICRLPALLFTSDYVQKAYSTPNIPIFTRAAQYIGFLSKLSFHLFIQIFLYQISSLLAIGGYFLHRQSSMNPMMFTPYIWFKFLVMYPVSMLVFVLAANLLRLYLSASLAVFAGLIPFLLLSFLNLMNWQWVRRFISLTPLSGIVLNLNHLAGETERLSWDGFEADISGDTGLLLICLLVQILFLFFLIYRKIKYTDKI